MAEIRRGFGGEGAGGDRLPWLEPVEYEDDQPVESDGGSGRGIVIGVIVLALFAIAVVAGIWISRVRAGHADIGGVIHAPPGPYKERPANPGGLQVDHSAEVAEKMGTGTDIDSPLDLTKLPEEPITGRHGAAAAAPQPATAAPQATSLIPTQAPAVQKAPAASPPIVRKAPASIPSPVATTLPPTAPTTLPKPAPTLPPSKPLPASVEPKQAPSSAGAGTIQLGALGSEAKAKQVWKSLSGRFAFLAPLGMTITPVEVNGTTLYRLRASGGDARRLCAQLKVAGEACSVVD
jgi:cell division septation protein DedD